MRRERGRHPGCIVVRLCVCISAVMPVASFGGDPLSPTPRPRVRLSGRTVKQVRGLPSCQVNLDCDDGDACTDDVCEMGVCTSTPIPGCVSCRPVRDDGGAPIDVVFVVDTSGSMRDEAAGLCAAIDQVVGELRQAGVMVDVTVLGITETPGGSFGCLTDSVVSLWPDARVDAGTGCPFPAGVSSFESWGSAAAVVAQSFLWTGGATRMIVPIGDEGPCEGNLPDGCNDPGDDRDAIEYAIRVSNENDVIVSPITGTGSDACVTALADELAERTCGLAFHTEDPGTDLAEAIVTIILESCAVDDTCDDDNFCTRDDVCTDGVCRGTPIEGCEPCDASGFCSDGNACTDDVCIDFTCVTTPNFDGERYCCSPVDRLLTLIDDDNPCTDDACNPDTGEVHHSTIEDGTPCDDGNECTIDDICDGDGVCRATPIDSLSCAADEDCFGGLCNDKNGLCVCNSEPELCLDPVVGSLSVERCYPLGEELLVNIMLNASTKVITGGQFLIEYDSTVLEVIDVIPGDGQDPNSPFSVEVFQTLDDPVGTIFYAVRIPFSARGTRGPAVMATIRLQPQEPCATALPFCFFNESPRSTSLTDVDGFPVAYRPCCSEELQITHDSLVLDCPDSVTVNADAGGVTALVTWAPVSVVGGCEGEAEIICEATHDAGVNINHLAAVGGRFPVGVSEFECRATDACGVTGSCRWSVEVMGVSTVEVNVELALPVTDGPLRRCVVFEFFSSCLADPVVVEQTLDFGPPFNLPGSADRVLLKVPPGRYECVTARDPLHTLRSVSALAIVDGKYMAAFEGDPFFGGNWLVGGNLNGDRNIDVLDLAVLGGFPDGSLVPADTPCGTAAPHADINGDGVVDEHDRDIIQMRLGLTDENACCPGGTAATATPPILELSVAELESMGLSHLRTADLNGDGMLSTADITAYMRGQRDVKSPRLRNPPER